MAADQGLLPLPWAPGLLKQHKPYYPERGTRYDNDRNDSYMVMG